MKSRWFRICFLAVLLSFSNHLSAQSVRSFERISVSDGLSNNNVQCIVQDEIGYIWFGTYDGLNRYNGYSFDLFVKESGNDASLRDSNIYSLLVDSRGDLWVGSKYGGLARFDTEKETFENWLHDPEDSSSISDDWVYSIYEDSSGQVWIGTSNGLNKINFEPDETVGRSEVASFERYYYQRSPDRKIQAITEADEHTLYLSTSKGLLLFDTQREEFVSSYLDQDALAFGDKFSISGGLLLTSPDSLLIGSYAGLFKMSRTDAGARPFMLKLNEPTNLSRINSMLKDRNGNLWIGSNTGLVVHDTKSGRSRMYIHDFKNSSSLSHKSVQAIYEDRSGIIWFGTLAGGISKYDPDKIKFPLTYPEINLANSQGKRSFISACKTSDGHEWIGNDSGLYEFSEGNLINSFTSQKDIKTISRGGVTSILEMANGDLMVSTWGGGLNLLDRKTNLFHRYGYSFDEGMNTNDRLSCCITDMIQEDDGVLWLSTIYGFLERFDSKNGTFQSFKIGEWIWEIWLEKETNTLYLATENGLATFDIKSNEIEHFVNRENDPKSISHSRAWAVFKDSKDKIWVGTYNGLEEFDRVTKTFKRYTDPTLDHLSVYGILEDEMGDLWLGTQNGISKFDRENKSFVHFTAEDGAYTELKWSHKNPDGKMFFGGTNGFASFDPASIKVNDNVPDLVFTDFKVFNESVRPGENSLLKSAIDHSRTITLPYESNVFSIEFAALNFSSTAKNSYAFKLEGFDEDWNYSGSQRTASYTNLDPGDYEFKVKASNNDHIWNEAGASLQLTITPPFWGTWWFRVLLILSILATIMIWFQVRFRQIKRKKLILEKLVRQRTEELEIANLSLAEQKEQVMAKNDTLEIMAEEVRRSSEMRTRFFTNVSHEFRTPLTLITAPLEKLFKETRNDPRINRSVELAVKNSRRLLRLINQLLDVSKIDSGFMKIHLTEGNIESFIRQIFDSFNFRAKKQGIRYEFVSNLENPVCVFDMDKLEKIMYNLLGNAFKFTPEEGNIKLEIKGEADEKGLKNLIVMVSDSGIGIRQEDLTDIFGRFVRKNHSETKESSSGGIGLSLAKSLAELHKGSIEVQSKEKEGIRFTVRLGVRKSMFENDPIIATESKDSEAINLVSPDYDALIENRPKNGVESLDQDAPLILIVEDNVELKDFMATELSANYNVITATNGKEGWKKCLKNLPDMVISDIMMPEMNGIELCSHIKKEAETCHILTVLLTAKATIEDQKTGLQKGADDYITKPFNMEILHLKIRNLLDTRHRMQERFRKGGFVPELINGDHRDKVLLKSCVATVHEEMANANLDVNLLCKKVGISRSLLYAKMKSITGESVNEFIRNIRLQAAAEIMLKYIDRPMGHIFVDVGFSNQSHFNRSFKDKFGMPPKQYRKLHLSESE